MPLAVTNFDSSRHVTVSATPQQDLGGRRYVKLELKAREGTAILTLSPEQAETTINKLNDALDTIEAKGRTK